MGRIKKVFAGTFRALYRAGFFLVSRAFETELSRRNALRGRNALRWFTPEEAAVAQALARIIVPSDEETPGIDEVEVLGPPAINVLDHLLVVSAWRRPIYCRGLLSFDLWAHRTYHCKFAEMPAKDQVLLLRTAQQYYERFTAQAPVIVRAWRRLSSIASVNSGRFYAAQLYPQIRTDCFQVFYTSRVSWIWLEYDGPPMSEGYPHLAARHSSSIAQSESSTHNEHRILRKLSSNDELPLVADPPATHG